MNRATLCLALLGLTLAAVAGADAQPGPQKLRVYFGTYTRGKDKGIFRAELDLATGKLSAVEPAGEAVNPSFLAIHPNRRFLYAVSEVATVDGKRGGGVSAFAIDPATGNLTLLNQESSGGAGPCHLVVDPAGKNVLVANYGGGSTACLPLGEDGRVKASSSFQQHQGKSVNPKRQGEPHAHSVNLDPSGRFAFVADLGLDKVLVYKLDADGKLTANEPPAAAVAPGSGPRHFAFHPTGRYAYVINELANTVTAFAYNPQDGVLKEVQTITTLPEGFTGTSYTAEVQVHPSGKFVYGSNRGHDSIAIFSVDADTGKLTAVGHEPIQGKTPRNFGIDPTGAYLLAAGQDSNSVVVFRIDPQTGKLTATGSKVDVPSPVCVKFLPLEAR
jgi:6-phosphogluconolactonase